MPRRKKGMGRPGVEFAQLDGRSSTELIERGEIDFWCGVCGARERYARPAFAPKERMKVKTGYYTWGERLCRACLAYIGEVYLARRAELLLPLAVQDEVEEKRRLAVERELDCRLRYDGWPAVKGEEGGSG